MRRLLAPLIVTLGLAAGCDRVLGLTVREEAVCEAGAFQCANAVAFVCADDGSGWLLRPCAKSETCVDDACVPADPDYCPDADGTALPDPAQDCMHRICLANHATHEPDDSDVDPWHACANGAKVPADHTPIALAHGTGVSHVCALTYSGRVACWGSNSAAQLGQNHALVKEADVPVWLDASDVAQVSIGSRHTCVRTNDGHVRCGGDNDFGQVRDGAPSGDPVWPLEEIPSLFGALDLGAGNGNTCVVDADGAPACMGKNDAGQLGTGMTGAPGGLLRPNLPQGFVAPALQVVSGADTACSRHANGAVLCWGRGYLTGTGIDNNPPLILPPTPIDSSAKAAHLAAGDAHTCFATELGGAVCFGGNGDGQTGGAGDAYSPRSVFPDGSGVMRVSGGFRHSCALLADGRTFCWGSNNQGALGDPSFDGGADPEPRLVAAPPARDVSAPWTHSCILSQDDRVLCWGANESGQLGRGQSGDALASSSTPAEVVWPPVDPSAL